jgi:uncharacterized protein YfaT (DUF1175 family)
VLIASVTRLPRTLLPVIAAALVAATSSVHAQDARGVSLESKKPFAAFSSSAERLRDSIVLKAKGSVGTRYKLGGTKQAQFGKAVPKDVAALKPGDVLTFGRGKRISHVGIYVGDGKMIHASTSQRRVVETTITKRSPLIRQWKGVRRFVDANTAQLRDSILAMADSLR